jgi:hypothetical protein
MVARALHTQIRRFGKEVCVHVQMQACVQYNFGIANDQTGHRGFTRVSSVISYQLIGSTPYVAGQMQGDPTQLLHQHPRRHGSDGTRGRQVT